MDNECVFKLIIEDAKDVDSHAFRHDKIAPLLNNSGIPYTIKRWDWLNAKTRARVFIATNSEKEGRDLRRVLREDPDIWFYRDEFAYHCAPISRKPVPIKRNEELFELLMDTAKKNNIYENTARIVHNRIVENRLVETWKTMEPSELLLVNGLGKKAVELILLARGDDLHSIEEKDYSIPDISAEMKEVLLWEENRPKEFEDLRNKIIKYSRHPECVDILINFAFDLGCEWQAGTCSNS